MSKYRTTKKQNDTSVAQVEKFSDYFNALSHPHRLKIFLNLASRCSEKSCSTDSKVSACISDVGMGLDIAPSTLSHHIKELKRVGLVHVERKGQAIGCWVESETIKEIKNFFSNIQSCK